MGLDLEREETALATWNEFKRSSPDIADKALGLLARAGAHEGHFTTVSGADPPRTHPVNVGVVDGRLLVFVQGKSAKARDLADDGRYSLVNHQVESAPHELLIRGRAKRVESATERRLAAEQWAFDPGDSYPLYELGIDSVLLGERNSPDEWPPRYTSWRADD